ncbi:hypothetical protein C9374_002108 [Naegleria lovaniensis]|uniref:Uncharacterized protein n=1 Tax=Naegleria lovaniensis TaxID=51637 RepID=A0AA88GWF7_NAELO|nr:uncharacterized protein C9374_002108 [Naegleria lovaniensis]KAG2387073.1 hypothetical protein C9374_002108 [Naegleria lovaniensis]
MVQQQALAELLKLHCFRARDRARRAMTMKQTTEYYLNSSTNTTSDDGKIHDDELNAKTHQSQQLFDLIPFGNSKGVEYLRIVLSNEKYLLNTRDELMESMKQWIHHFVNRNCNIEDIGKYLYENNEDEYHGMEEELNRCIHYMWDFKVFEAKIDLLDYYLQRRLDLVWSSEKFNHCRKKRNIVIIFSQIKQIMKRCNFLISMIRKKFEIIFKQYKQFEILLGVNLKNSGFVITDNSITEVFTNFDLNGIDIHSLFKLQILHLEQVRAEIVSFFSNIMWTKNDMTDCVSLDSFQNFIFSREIDSPLKEFFLLYQSSFTPHHHDGTRLLYDPLVEELTMKQQKQKRLRNILSLQLEELQETDKVQNYFRKLFAQHRDSTKPLTQQPPNTLRLFNTGDLFSSKTTKQESTTQTVYSLTVLKTTIEEAFTQHELMDFLTVLFPS